MELEKLVKKCGLGLAVALQWGKLSQNQHFVSFLKLREWLEIYDAALTNSELEKLALQKMSELAQTFDEWRHCYDIAHEGSELEKLALQKMSELAQTFDEWRFVYDNTYPGSELEKLAFEKMQGMVN